VTEAANERVDDRKKANRVTRVVRVCTSGAE
jgi:hypothetical protein